MNRPTRQNFFAGGKGDETAELRMMLARKEEDFKVLQDKYDRLFISKLCLIQAKTRRDRSRPKPDREYLKENLMISSKNGKLKRNASSKTNNG
jgi:hypothetical protein